MYYTLRWDGGSVSMLDQRRLPAEEIYHSYRDYREVARAIREMVIRGAPAIGVAAAMGVALGAHRIETDDPHHLREAMQEVFETIAAARPTAVNLFWAVERMRRLLDASLQLSVPAIKERLRDEALRIYEEDVEANRRLGRHGQIFLADEDTVLTHCNAGALATAGYGTALGVIRAAVEAGKRIRVIADETRPYLQGARLTCWELLQNGIPVTLITDNMAGYLMSRGEIQKVVVGADRIAANGDVANKIGTYTVAVMAHRHGIPFLVAAPRSTIDLACASGAEIPIEERGAAEVTHFFGARTAPEGVEVRNPAFDVTPAELVHAIITEAGVARPPYAESLPRLFSSPPE